MYSLYIHGQTDRAQILCGTLNDPGEGLYMINILRISLQQNSIFIHEIFFIVFVLQCIQIENVHN